MPLLMVMMVVVTSAGDYDGGSHDMMIRMVMVDAMTIQRQRQCRDMMMTMVMVNAMTIQRQ